MEIGKMEDFTIDQFAGSLALILGSIGGLLMIIWKSRCECDINLCFLCRCHRAPPKDIDEAASDDEEKVLPKKKIIVKNTDIQEPEPEVQEP